MLRLSGLNLPLDHEAEALPAAICARLAIPRADLKRFTVYRRGNDARRRSAIMLVYTLDLELADEADVLARFPNDKDLKPTPDTQYRFVAQAHPDTRRAATCGKVQHPA